MKHHCASLFVEGGYSIYQKIQHKIKIALVAGYLLLILATSLIPMDGEIKGFRFFMEIKPTIQNLAHIPMFAILSILLLQRLKVYQIGCWKRVLIVLFSAAAFGIINEVIQLFIPGRYPSIMDAGLNTIGILLGMLIYFLFERSRAGLIRRIICN